jgi:hypothetical protein
MNTPDEPVPFNLGDKRLDRRAQAILQAILAQPGASIPAAARSPAAARATYDFYDNRLVDPRDIDEAHRRHTLSLIARCQGPILVPQDTSEIDWTSPARSGRLGQLGSAFCSGMLLHSALALDERGVPLGLLHLHAWMRDPAQRGKRKDRRRKETAAKESQRWLDAEQACADAVPAERLLVCIGDREADFYDLFALPRRHNHHVLVRANGVRRLKGTKALLGAAVADRPVAGTRPVEVPRKDGRPGRKALLSLRFGEFSVMPPSTHPRRKDLPPLALRAVLAREEPPPAEGKPLEWLLLTSLPVASAADAGRLVGWYVLRWRIERWHYTLKSGCKVEDLQLEAAERLRRALAMHALAASRLLRLTYLAREQPQASCEPELARDEWEVLQRHFKPEGPLPEQPPTLREVTRWVARLGGFLGRKGDGEPGVKTLWRGLARLDAMVAGFRLATGPPGQSSRQ